MKNFILILAFFLIATNAWCQWFYGSGKAVNLENDIGYNKNTQLIKSGVTSDPQTASISAGAGSLLLKTDGQLYVKKDEGLTTNWKKVLDESFDVSSLIPTATATTTGLLSNSDWTIFNAKESTLSFTSPLNRVGNVIDIPVATTATSGYLSNTDWNTFNGKQNDLGFTPENTANKSTNTSLGTSDTLYPTQKAVKTYVDTQIGSIPSGKTLVGVSPISITQDATTATFTVDLSSKQDVLTNPVTGTGSSGNLSKFTGASTVGNSIISDDGTTIAITGNLETSHTSKLANEYLVASNKVDGSFEKDTAFWSTSNGTIVRTANTATTTISGNYNGVWSGTGTSSLDLQWTATASNTYEPSMIVQIPTGQTASNYTICAVVNGVETGCKVLDYCELDRQCKVSVVADSVLGSSFYLRLKHTGSGAFFAVVDSGKIETWTPNVANLVEKASARHYGTGLLSTTGVIRFPSTQIGTSIGNFLSYDSSTGRYTALRSCKLNVASTLVVTASGAVFSVRINGSGAFTSSSPSYAGGYQSSLSTGEFDIVAGQYIDIYTASTVADNASDFLSITATAISENIIQSYQNGMATTATLSYAQVNALVGNQGLGTFTAGYVSYVKVGDSLHYSGKLTVGSTTAVEARIPFPNGLISADTSRIPDTGLSGSIVRGAASSGFYHAIISPSVGYFSFGIQGASNVGMVKATGSNFISGETFSFELTVPIQGWSSAPTLLALPTSKENVFSAKILVDGATTNNPTILSTSSDFLNSIVYASDRRYSIDYTKLGLAVAPVIIASMNFTDGTVRQIEPTSVTSTTAQLFISPGDNGPYHISFALYKQSPDYTAPGVFVGNINPDGFNRTSGVTGLVENFSFSYGTTNATTVCSASPCSYLDQIGNNVTSVTRQSTGNYTVIFSKTFSKLKCSGLTEGLVTMRQLQCSNCSSVAFGTGIYGTAMYDTAGTILCQGQL